MATNSGNTPARRIEDRLPDAQIDWTNPDAPAVPQSSNAGAARQGGNTSDIKSPNLAAPASQAQAAPTGICHELKTDPEVFAAVLAGEKTHEIRLNDRNFAVGDELLLRETAYTGTSMQLGAPLEYTGREMRRTVSHVLTGYGLMPGWCILSLAAPAVIDQPTAAEIRARALEEAAKLAEAQNRVGYEWVKDSVWDNIISRVPAAIRALASKEAAPAEVPSQDPKVAQLRRAIETVCEGWTLPSDARKVLETALWTDPVQSRTQGESGGEDA